VAARADRVVLPPDQPQEVESQLQKYRASVDDINRHSAAGAREGVYVDPDELIRRNTHNLMAAVSSLPELQVRVPARVRAWVWVWVCGRGCKLLCVCGWVWVG